MVEDKPKGKPCNDCGSPLVNLYGSGGGRICSGCKREFDWQLDKNQKPLIGSNRSYGMIRVDVVVAADSEASFDIERTMAFIKQLVAERDNAVDQVLQYEQKLKEAENGLSEAERILSDAERALELARERFRDYMSDEGVL